MTEGCIFKLARNNYRYIRRKLAKTPLTSSPLLGDQLRRSLFLKWENKLLTGSFKERGVVTLLSTLKEEKKLPNRVCAASAGNHALALSYHAKQFDLPCTLVMPKLAPAVKAQRARAYGAEVRLEGDSFDEAYRIALSLAKQEESFFVPPFDHPLIVAGQASIGFEILEDCPECDSIIIPVGGGGLAGGISTIVKHLKPDIFVLGVQSDWVTKLNHSQRPASQKVPTIADGIAVKSLGTVTKPLINRYVDRLVSVSESQLAEAVVHLVEYERAIVEGAGAAGLAALLNGYLPERFKKPVVVLSGGNIDLSLISRLLGRSLAKRGQLARFKLSIPDQPGALNRITEIVSKAGANTREVYHDRSFAELPGTVEVVLVIEVVEAKILEEIEARLAEQEINLTSI